MQSGSYFVLNSMCQVMGSVQNWSDAITWANDDPVHCCQACVTRHQWVNPIYWGFKILYYSLKLFLSQRPMKIPWTIFSTENPQDNSQD